jgi:hypothetical protein
MIELVRTNDPVIISFVEALLKDAGIVYFVTDQNMSVNEGSIGILARRVMVEDARLDEATDKSRGDERGEDERVHAGAVSFDRLDEMESATMEGVERVSTGDVGDFHGVSRR